VRDTTIRDLIDNHKLGFRLKFMQAVALATNDEFLVSYNLSIDAGDVLEYMKNLTYGWMDRKFSKYAEFDDLYNVNMSLVAGPSGYCYNFNMANASDLLHLDLYDHLLLLTKEQFQFSFRLPPHFNFTRSHFERTLLLKHRGLAENSTKPYPWSAREYLSGYITMVDLASATTTLNGSDVNFYAPNFLISNFSISTAFIKFYGTNHHKTFDYRGVNYWIHSPYEWFSKLSAHHRSMTTYSIIVYLNPQKVLIDEALESYPPQRFEIDA
jgi:hypothetical protein